MKGGVRFTYENCLCLRTMVGTVRTVVGTRKGRVKHQRIVGQVTEEGEVLEGARLVLSYDRPKPPYRQFLVMNQGEELEEARARWLERSDVERVLMALKRLDYENLMVLNHTEIAERLGMRRPHVSRAVAKLVEVGVILAGLACRASPPTG